MEECYEMELKRYLQQRMIALILDALSLEEKKEILSNDGLLASIYNDLIMHPNEGRNFEGGCKVGDLEQDLNISDFCEKKKDNKKRKRN